jgi:transcriptional regulator with XRE-family HTH domain
LIDEAYRRDYPDDDIGPHVGANVAALREREGISQAELAKAANIRGPNLSRLETGKHVPTLGVLLRVAQALHVTLGKLLGPTIRLESSKKRICWGPEDGVACRGDRTTWSAERKAFVERLVDFGSSKTG